MSMLGKRRRILLLWCSVPALASALGFSASATLADQEVIADPSAAVTLRNATPEAALAGDTSLIESAADFRQLMRLAELQRKQIVMQRQQLGLDPLDGAVAEPMPTDVNALNQLIESQQRVIEAQNQQLTLNYNASETTLAATEIADLASASAKDAVSLRDSQTDLDDAGERPVALPASGSVSEFADVPRLPTDLPEQDRLAREEFDLAVAANRQQADATDSGHTILTVESLPQPGEIEPTVVQPAIYEGQPVREVSAAAALPEDGSRSHDTDAAHQDQAQHQPEVVQVASQTDETSEIEALRKALRQQSELLERQAQQLEEHRLNVEAQRRRLDELERQVAAQPDVQPVVAVPQLPPQVRSATFVPPRTLVMPDGGAYSLVTTEAGTDDGTPPPVVGEEQGEQEGQRVREIAGVQDAGGVLSQAGSIIIEPSIQYSQSNINRFFFQGLEIVDTVLIGNIEATDSDRDTLTAKLSARYGINSRLEVGASVPWVYRDDRITRQIVSTNTTSTTVVDGSGIGDVEVSGRYQINPAGRGWPIFIANGRFKSDTGEGPFDVPRDPNGIETELATGSGFLGFEPGLTTLIRSDPVVFFINGRYLFHLGKDVNTVVGSSFIGHVDPGDVVSFAAGMGFGINEEASFSLGYDHSFVMATKTEINGIDTESTDIDVGSLSLGFSYRISPLTSVNFTVKAGVTADAPDVQMILRMPFRF